ncbi:hypothetical protein BT63DRAFT_461453 [Microthyrium microscopicum]|uniref:Uncharacterized protein n=1 Tax=Microthyrium microscopicum TaxID=703497 RepID=A0A6A6TXF8_9PEZI|nr:hypothetical protein BT63DRAFT_461453 [Microthyrium microscopicum]
MAPTPTSDEEFQVLDAALTRLNTYSKLLYPESDIAKLTNDIHSIRFMVTVCMVAIMNDQPKELENNGQPPTYSNAVCHTAPKQD